MYRRMLIPLLVIMACALTQAVPVSAQTATPTTKPAATQPMPMTPHKLANSVAVCGCGKVFVPNASTKTFTYQGQEFACCSDACHQKLAGMPPADAAKACMEQMKKLESAAPATGK